jgi:hypothetical protein
LGSTEEQGGLLGRSEACSEQAPLKQTASIVQDLAEAGIRVKPGYVSRSLLENISCLSNYSQEVSGPSEPKCDNAHGY